MQTFEVMLEISLYKFFTSLMYTKKMIAQLHWPMSGNADHVVFAQKERKKYCKIMNAIGAGSDQLT